ncbi:hypothetical protein C5E11_04010 [Clavibacter michiganensis]|nr:hypothetical protein [Clavibacter michiganensis]PPF64562.1 hypothetical protein C5E11_04010 [Clavibacter michiganensis]
MKTFEIAAEYLHLYVGRRAATVGWGSHSWIPFTIGAVRYHPESGLVVVTPIIPTPALLDFGFSPDVIVRVEYSNLTVDPRPLTAGTLELDWAHA